MIPFTVKSLLCGVLAASVALGAESDFISSGKPSEIKYSRALKSDEGTGKLYFTGPGYTINLINHVLYLGLLGFALIYLYGDRMLGTDAAEAAAPSTDYGAPEADYGAPSPSYTAPAPSYLPPSTSYDAGSIL